MIDHLSTYATNFEATRDFYAAALGTLGYTVQMQFTAEWNEDFPEQRMCALGPTGRPVFWIIETREAASPRHVAFTAASRADVDSYHRHGVEAGGVDNGAPGPRPQYHEHYYGAFVLDPDGNNTEAVCHAPP